MSENRLAAVIACVAALGCGIASTAIAATVRSASQSINGSDGLSINGSDGLSINGSDGRSINGSDRYSINGSDGRSINGSDRYSINGSDAAALFSAELLAIGRIDMIGDGFISVLGQTVFGSREEFAELSIGSTIAVYGELDMVSGAFANTRLVSLAAANSGLDFPDFLRGTVDAVDMTRGMAVVNGMTVDYTAMLADGSAPRVGQAFAVVGRNHGDIGVLVADPQLSAGL